MPKRKSVKTKPVVETPATPEVSTESESESDVDLNPNRGETESYAEYSARLAAILKTTKKLARQENKGAVLSEATAIYEKLIRTHGEQIAAEILALDPEKRIRALSVQISHVGDSDDVEVRIKSIRVAKPKPRNK